MLIGRYPTKDDLRYSLGKPLQFETRNRPAGEYRDTGTLEVIGPPVPGAPIWHAEVTLIDGRIVRVE